MREECGEGASFADREGTYIVTRSAGCDRVEFIQSWSANHVEDEVKLMTVISTREERPSCKELGKDATNGPYIDGLGVHLERQHYLRCTVPPGGHILRHHTRLFAIWRSHLHASREAKIAHLQIAVGIEEEIGRFEITMNDVRAVNRFESTESLVDKILRRENKQPTKQNQKKGTYLTVVIGKVLCADYTV